MYVFNKRFIPTQPAGIHEWITPFYVSLGLNLRSTKAQMTKIEKGVDRTWSTLSYLSLNDSIWIIKYNHQKKKPTLWGASIFEHVLFVFSWLCPPGPCIVYPLCSGRKLVTLTWTAATKRPGIKCQTNKPRTRKRRNKSLTFSNP